MFERAVLGLDIGSYSVKAAELRAGFRGVEFLRLEAARIPPDAAPEDPSESKSRPSNQSAIHPSAARQIGLRPTGAELQGRTTRPCTRPVRAEFTEQ